MKKYDHLFESVTDWDNLLLAYKKAEKGKRQRQNVIDFRFKLEENLFLLQDELKAGIYKPGDYRTFYIHEPKKRMISAAPFRDRVVHHALCNIIDPLLDKSLIHDTYANRKGKGTHAAIRRCQAFMRKYPYYLKCDIQKYFPSIDHEILKGMLLKRIICPKTQALICTIIDNSNIQEGEKMVFEGDDLFSQIRKKGLPMGNLTSQFFANFYLSPFDHFVKEKLKIAAYVRYVDDFILFARTKQELEAIKMDLHLFLSIFRLKIHPKKCHIAPTEKGVTFLGQRIFTTHRKLQSANVRKIWKTVKQVIRDFKEKRIDSYSFELRLNSWRGHAKQADTFQLQKRVFNQVTSLDFCFLEKNNGIWVLLNYYF